MPRPQETLTMLCWAELSWHRGGVRLTPFNYTASNLPGRSDDDRIHPQTALFVGHLSNHNATNRRITTTLNIFLYKLIYRFLCQIAAATEYASAYTQS